MKILYKYILIALVLLLFIKSSKNNIDTYNIVLAKSLPCDSVYSTVSISDSLIDYPISERKLIKLLKPLTNINIKKIEKSIKQKNKEQIIIALDSTKANYRTIHIDYNFYENNSSNWDTIYKKHPNFCSIINFSKATKLYYNGNTYIILYVQISAGPLNGIGYYSLYLVSGKKLKSINEVVMWVS